MKKTNIKLSNLDAISITTHPGLLGPLLTGLNAAKSISLLYKTPIIPINHLHAHLEAIHLTENIQYPYLGLLISGGHTSIYLVKSSTDFELLGKTLDDAAGEAFDKGGKLLNLGYPAGRHIDYFSKFSKNSNYKFPVGLIKDRNMNFSFSGLKTSLRNLIESSQKLKSLIQKFDLEQKEYDANFNEIYNICFSYQEAIAKALNIKLKIAYENIIKQYKLNKIDIVVGGGVACNSFIRETLTKEFDNCFFVKAKYCTDNGAMIANLGAKLFNQKINYPQTLSIDALSSIKK